MKTVPLVAILKKAKAVRREGIEYPLFNVVVCTSAETAQHTTTTSNNK
jgi:hypothetical protein